MKFTSALISLSLTLLAVRAAPFDIVWGAVDSTPADSGDHTNPSPPAPLPREPAPEPEADADIPEELIELESLEPRSCGAKLTQAQAEAKFKPYNIVHKSSGGCTNKNNKHCTSYQGICTGTVDGVITLKKATGVKQLVITGGTEVGHASGTYSHGNGHKVDLQHQAKLDSYIHNTFKKIGKRGDGFPQWKAKSGNIYCDEGTHWDVVYY